MVSAWFIGPFHAWIQENFGVHSRYQLVSLSYSLGSQIGGPTPALGLWLWKKTGNVTIPAVLIILWGVVGLIGISYKRVAVEEEAQPSMSG